MGYMHIDNLYRNQTVLQFKRGYALEKIHGTSAHVRVRIDALAPTAKVTYFAGAASHEKFKSLFNERALIEQAIKQGQPDITFYGEAYGGGGAAGQGMKHVYGPELKFIVFDVQFEDADASKRFASVPFADALATAFGLEFVHYEETDLTVEALDAIRDRPSVQAKRNGCGEQFGEGIVIRPLHEFTDHRGNRVIAKHKRPDFSERTSKADTKVVDPAQQKVLADAEAIALEWVTPMRLQHVLGKMTPPFGMEHTAQVIRAMQEDVLREGADEIVSSKEVERAIGSRTVQLFKQVLKTGNPG